MGKSIALIVDPGSALTASEPVQWVVEEFRQALTVKGIASTGSSSTFAVVVSPATAPLAKTFGNLPSITRPETTALIPGNHNNAPAILVTGIDARSIVYGLIELTERVRLNDNPFIALHLSAPVVEVTPNKVRSVARAFLSEMRISPGFTTVPSGRAIWIHLLSRVSIASISRLGSVTRSGARTKSIEFRQVEEDILIVNALGLYYANLFRATLFYSIYEETGDSAAATQSLAAYRKGRDAWANMAERAEKIYGTDISYGDIPIRRGHWADRLPEIDRDLAALERHFGDKPMQ